MQHLPRNAGPQGGKAAQMGLAQDRAASARCVRDARIERRAGSSCSLGRCIHLLTCNCTCLRLPAETMRETLRPASR
eukprot:319484-Pyramimonas_sp.AAC.1